MIQHENEKETRKSGSLLFSTTLKFAMPLREKLKDLKIYKINHSQFAMKKKEENSVTVKIFHQ